MAMINKFLSKLLTVRDEYNFCFDRVL